MLIQAILLSMRQLVDGRTFRLVLLVAGITLVLFSLLGVLGWQAMLRWVVPHFSGWMGADDAAGIAVVMTLILGWFLFRAVAMAVMGLFADSIIESVEEDHYPDVAARAVPVPFLRGVRMGLRSAARAIGWNLLAVPAYLVLLVTGVGTLILAMLLNAFLLGRDLEQMAAARHPDLPDRPLMRRERWILGLVSALAFALPVVNIVAPLFAAALAVHMLHWPQGRPS